MTFYEVLILIHILSAIVGIGPGFILTLIVMKAKTMTELRHAYTLRKHIHIFVMIGGIALLVTGLWMGALNMTLFRQGWYIISLILFLITIASGPLLLKPISTTIQYIISNHDGENIPQNYYVYARKLYMYEHGLNLVLVLIIILMILKPF